MVAPPWRLLCIAAVGTAGFLAPAATPSQPKTLRAQLSAAEREQRSAVLALYSLDAQLATASDRLGALRRTEQVLRAERAALEAQLRVATANARLAQRELAARVRSLYDHGSSSALEVIFGGGSVREVMTELDALDRVTSLDHQLLLEVRSAQFRELRTRRALGARATRLASAVQAAGAETLRLATARRERSAYLARLAAQTTLTEQELTRVEAQARTAAVKAERVQASATTKSPARGVTVVSTGYCLKGRTSTGLPASWGVAAVDPHVIPLGTRLTIPGYGEAIAADTGGSIVGGRIDLWFPSCARAGGWGSRSVTIALH